MYMTSEADINQITVSKKSYAQKVLFVFFYEILAITHISLQAFSKELKGLFFCLSHIYTQV